MPPRSDGARRATVGEQGTYVKVSEPPVDTKLINLWVDDALAESHSRLYRWEFVRQLAITLLCGAICALILHFAVQNYVVEGQSMLPTVRDGDHVLVDRIAYRIGEPARGDVVVFRFPAPGSTFRLIKRIIGLPGDVVQVRPGAVMVNGQVLREPYIHYPEQYSYGPARVPAAEYFVLGDNRWVSYDSHQWGFLPPDDIYGRVMATYWPMGDFHIFGL